LHTSDIDVTYSPMACFLVSDWDWC